MTQSTDDTQPRSPFQNQPPPQMVPPGSVPPPNVMMDDDDESGGPGCLLWGLVGFVSVILAAIIVMLASLAGWNSGLNVARVNATITQAALNQEQCNRISLDIENGNTTGLIQQRLDYLLQQTPAVDCVEGFIPTATAYYLASLPTETPTPTPTTPLDTPQPTPAPAEATEAAAPPVEATDEVVSGSGSATGFDLAGLLAEAREQISFNEWSDAIDTLDAIIAIDANYEKTEVERLLFQSLTSEANRLFQTGSLAEAIVLTDRAEEFGDVENLNYERWIAGLYLDAQRYVDVNRAEAIRLLNIIVREQNLINYQGGAASKMLFDQYVAYAEALEFSSDYCLAVAQYDNAIQLNTSATLNQPTVNLIAKRDSAQTTCTQLTAQPGLTVEPGATIEGGGGDVVPTATIAPVGQPG